MSTCTWPCLSGWVSMTPPSGHLPLGSCSSCTSTTSLTVKFFCGTCHFCQLCIVCRYSCFQRTQNCLARYWTCRHRLREKSPGGRFGDALISSRWFGVSGSSLSGSRTTGVRGREFMMDSTSAMTAARPSSVTVCRVSSAPSIYLTEHIKRSQSPPMWLA